MKIDRKIIFGMAEIFFASAWADHVEEYRCSNLSGKEITEIMPKIPEFVFRACERIGGHIEAKNNNSLVGLLNKAAEADGIHDKDLDDYIIRYAERFGNCLMFSVMGAGVSWFDNHAEFPLADTYGTHEQYYLDARFWCEEHCKECDIKYKRNQA